MTIKLTGDVEGTVDVADLKTETIAAAIKAKFEEHPDVSQETVWRLVSGTLEFENDYGHAVAVEVG